MSQVSAAFSVLHSRLNAPLASDPFVLALNTGVHKKSDVVDQPPGRERIYLRVCIHDRQLI